MEADRVRLLIVTWVFYPDELAEDVVWVRPKLWRVFYLATAFVNFRIVNNLVVGRLCEVK